jgi:FixJ family two-component response regulator
MSTVFVVDDDASMRAALASLLRSVGIRVMPFASASQFLEASKPDDPSCLVLDVRLPGLSGLELQEELTREGVHIPVIFLTGHGDIPMSVRAIKAGAVEFLTKPVRDQDLLDAIQSALRGEQVRRDEERRFEALRQRYGTLTPRERDVFAFVVSGRLNKQIAAELGTSEVTTKVHRSHVMRKMHAESVADLVRMASRLGIEPC